jgi:hypothetical protein
MAIQLDVLYRDVLLNEPELGYAATSWSGGAGREPASLLGLLVVEYDGSVVPISYGFSRDYEVCNLSRERLIEAWQHFLTHRYSGFRAVCRGVFDSVAMPTGPTLFNWHERVVKQSRRGYVASE